MNPMKSSLICALSLSATLISCGPKDADKVGEAQLCLDKAAQGAAAACLEKIAGIDTAAANTMRCSAGFIDEGFTQPARFKSALDALSQQTNGQTNTLTFLSYIAFSSKATAQENSDFAEATYSACVKSEAKGLTMLGSMAMTATTISAIAGTVTQGDGAGIQAAITTLLNSGDPAATAAVGSAVITTYNASCVEGAEANQGLCDQLNTYLADAGGNVDTSDPQAVGQTILERWRDQTPSP